MCQAKVGLLRTPRSNAAEVRWKRFIPFRQQAVFQKNNTKEDLLNNINVNGEGNTCFVHVRTMGRINAPRGGLGKNIHFGSIDPSVLFAGNLCAIFRKNSPVQKSRDFNYCSYSTMWPIVYQKSSYTNKIFDFLPRQCVTPRIAQALVKRLRHKTTIP